jgi:hypothetical protein
MSTVNVEPARKEAAAPGARDPHHELRTKHEALLVAGVRNIDSHASKLCVPIVPQLR